MSDEFYYVIMATASYGAAVIYATRLRSATGAWGNWIGLAGTTLCGTLHLSVLAMLLSGAV